MFQSLTATLLPPLLDRAVLVVNHVLRAQPLACERLLPHAGRTCDLAWLPPAGPWPVPPAVRLRITPAGMLERCEPGDVQAQAGAASLRVLVELPAPHRLLAMSLAGQRPRVAVEGDAQLAADVAWLTENLRWDVEHDLARLVGDAPARLLAEWAQVAAKALRGLAQGVTTTWPDTRNRRNGEGSAAPR